MSRSFDKIFRQNTPLVQTIISKIRNVTEDLISKGLRNIKIMTFCGTHEWTTVYYGIRSLLPKNIELVAGPGCPVCITPSEVIENAIRLAMEGIRIYTYGDAYRVPILKRGLPRSLMEAESFGGNVKSVYSFLDAIKDSRLYGKESVFLGIGFETTAPAYAIPFAHNIVPKNLSFLSSLRLTPPIMRYTLDLYMKKGIKSIDGVIAPGHVSTIIGAESWEFLPREFSIPTVVAGFEPLDVLLAIVEILRMINENRPGIIIEYRRAVTWHGNLQAKKVIYEVFSIIDAGWRGIGFVPRSGLDLQQKYRNYNAYEIYGLSNHGNNHDDLPPLCKCSEVVLGILKPIDCPLFMKVCTPERPYGPCMVSEEGTCLIWAKYGGFGEVI
ncbi:hydrogenase formation HypD protein [Ignisphaera aggregans DSM 17230]|uniref:Hydrogenase formation HypD protein n=1 Tax=Ignisphaera aggregans (strain DSM 17230 / JCM 13409 / AQ1.S1) TaxID=583356 RepID=E0SQY6_IGNAA|nr:hydrogenase formation HypD protein [Ignisphaera aggregans DSM 17230]